MRLLAIDTALAACTAAVFDSERDIIAAAEIIPMERGHAEALLPLIVRVMDQAGVEFGALDRVAVTVGPGSFTGIRVGIAAARGIALTAAKYAVGVSTLAAFAAPCITGDRAALTLATVDARHGHVYAQVFGPGGRTLVAATHCPIADAIALTSGEVHLAGSAAQLVADAWPASRPKPLAVRQAVSPDIGWVARLGAVADPKYAPAKPLYLREPDARPQDGARVARQ